MRGEFIGVWSETWREIWLPLIDHEDVPDDIFCELYRVLAPALQEATGEESAALLVDDAVLLREEFHDAVQRSGVQLRLESIDKAFDKSGATEIHETRDRRAAAAESLRGLVGDKARTHFDEALSAIANVASKISEARARAVERTVNDRTKSREAFESVGQAQLGGERALVGFFEAAHDALEELSGDELTNRHFNLLSGFIDKFSLRYDLRRPCILCPTLPGVFASLVRDLRALTSQDPHLDALMKDFEDAVRDLRHDTSDRRIKTCIQKQVNLLEAIGRAAPGVTGTTLGAICNQVGTWPHEKLRAAMKDLYGFASDYPGIRHGGTPASALRAVDMRDMVAMSILLTGFTPYLESRLSADAIFGGSVIHAGPIPPVAMLANIPAGASDTLGKPRGFLERFAFWRREQ